MADFNFSIDLKRELLRLLDDPDIRKKLRGMEQGGKPESDYQALQEEYGKLQKDHNELRKKCNALQEDNEALQRKWKALEQEKVDLREKRNEAEREKAELIGKIQEMEQEKKKVDEELATANTALSRKDGEIIGLKSQNEQYNARIGEYGKQLATVEGILKAEEQREHFQGDTVKFLNELAGGPDIMQYLFIGRSKNLLKQLRDFIKDKAIKKDRNNDEVAALGRFFDYLVKLNNGVQKDNPFSPVEVELGKDYDSAIMIKTGDSRLNGCVEKVLVNGYKDAEGDYEFKAIVLVR